MSDFAKLVGRFFARDFLYFLAGLNVILAFLVADVFSWNLDRLLAFISKIPSVMLVPTAGAAYVLGYAVNYIFGLIGLHSAGDRLVPWSKIHRCRGWIARTIFWCLNRYDMKVLALYIEEQVTFNNYTELAPSVIYALQSLHPRGDYVSRAITLHHLSSVVGSSLVISGFLFLRGHYQHPNEWSLLLTFVTLGVGVLLCLDSNYRSSQIAFAIAMMHKWKPKQEAESEI
jgi:hypothetical protein